MRDTLIFDTFYSWHEAEPLSFPNGPRIKLSLQDSETLFITGEAPYHFNIAPTESMGRLWGLWEYEVLEVFIYGDREEYLELEFGPWGHHLALYFNGVRILHNDQVKLKYVQTWRRESFEQGASWGFSCTLPIAKLPLSMQKDQLTWRINAFWCYDRKAEHREFCCAYRLPGDQPNFHQPQHFPKWCFEPSVSES